MFMRYGKHVDVIERRSNAENQVKEELRPYEQLESVLKGTTDWTCVCADTYVCQSWVWQKKNQN